MMLILLMFCASAAHSQEKRTEITVDFRVNSTYIDSTFADNAARTKEIVLLLRGIRQDSTIRIIEVSFCGAASPEGSYQLNRRLSHGRLEALESIVRNEVDLPDSIIRRDDSYISWEHLKEQVENSDIAHRQEILDIINLEPRLVDYHGNRHIDHRIVSLMNLDEGKVWKQLHRQYFASMRHACAVIITYKRIMVPDVEAIAPVLKSSSEPGPSVNLTYADTGDAERWTPDLHIKTNLLGLGLAISNIGAEIDITRHLSFAIPVYYSALDYFTPTVKFRTLAVQPELRFWLSEDNEGFFAGAHFGYAQYNLATNGDYRYQDHKGLSPAVGGGISAGYRMPISKSGRWNIEFTLGAGCYGLHYDRFYNVENGKLIDTTKKTYWGIDNAAVNITYKFDLKKRKK